MKSTTATRLFALFFWVFNLTVLLIIYVGILPFLAPAIVADAIAGEVPFNFTAPFIGLVVVPTVCTLLGFLPKRRQWLSLFQLFYAVEAPLLLVCLVRFLWLRDLTPATSLLLATAVVGTSLTAHWLVSEQIPQPKWSEGLHLAGLSLMLGISSYLLALLAFYILPVTWSFLFVLGSPAIVLFIVALPLSVLLVGTVTMPIGMTPLYYRSWRQSWQTFAERHGKGWASALSIAVLTVWVGCFITLQQQPQIRAFALLQKPAATDSDRQALVQQSDVIRQGLLNAYLAPYRYSWIEDTHIQNLYEYTLSFPEGAAQMMQALYNTLTSPFHYQGELSDRERAKDLYARFFDTPIERGELPAIQKAIESTFLRTEAKAGLLDINERRVWLANQTVTVKPQGDWAEVELYEVYHNHTFDQQEILYYFSLPESAAVTGLWLGETSDRAKAFPFTLSTRGAAQQVYNQEVNRRVDPALLEQVGPRNYRLRAFPIPPEGTGEMHLWLTYKVLKQESGWALPVLNERRNVFWTDKTKRIVNGKSGGASEQWLPAAIAADNVQPVAHQVTLASGAHVLANPFDPKNYQLPQGKRFAIVLDGSYSMNAHRQEMEQTFRWLQEAVLPKNSADLYLTATAPAQPKRLDNLQGFTPEKAVFYGTLQPRQMLQQFQQQRGNTQYDVVLLISDPGSYELSTDSNSPLSIPAPVWLVHLGGLQPAYDDATLEAIQASGGGVSTQVQEVMQRLGTQPTLGTGTSLLSLVDGYTWFLSQTPNSAASKAEGFSALAARQWVTHLSEYVKPSELKQLDTIHAVTKTYNVVTPYSSMIVLVNDRQRQALKQAEQSNDRFQREVEDQQLPQPSSVTAPVSAVPEPAEWLLLIAAAIVLGVFYYPRFRPVQSPSIDQQQG